MIPFTIREVEAIGREAAQAAWAEGLTVHKSAGEVVPIPVVVEPVVLSTEAASASAREASLVLSGAVKLARALLAGGDARDREALLGPFQGLEAEAMTRLFDGAPCPVIMGRVDFLRPADGVPRALELNATIPAMTGYSDLVAHAFIRAAARVRGLPPRRAEDLVALCGSNMERLREALVAHYASRGGTRARPSIAVVARPGDAQLGELGRLVRHLQAMGHAAEVLTPDTCEPERWDLLYRHVWAHRTPEGSPFARALRAPERFVLANPVNGLLEAKALFARLSEAAEDGGLAARAGLDPEERAAAGRLPRTRRLDEGIAQEVLADRGRWVLKRSWDYGGKSVMLGALHDDAGWVEAVRAALADRRGGGFVAQERVVVEPAPATRVAADGVTHLPLYRDLSTYCGLGPRPPCGSVVRAATAPVVNILGGGGLAPVLPEAVWAALA